MYLVTGSHAINNYKIILGDCNRSYSMKTLLSNFVCISILFPWCDCL